MHIQWHSQAGNQAGEGKSLLPCLKIQKNDLILICNLYTDFILCYVMHQVYSEFWHIQHSGFSVICQHSIIFSVIKVYSRILRHYKGIFTLIQGYSAPCLTLAHSAYLESETYLKPCKRLSRHIQSPAIEHYSAIFRHIQNLVQHFQTQKPGIIGILEYSEPFHNCILTHIQNPVVFTKIYEYSDLRHI